MKNKKNIISVLRQIYGLRCKSKKGAVLGKQHLKEKLALKSYEQNNGFSAMSVDELYFINGGSFSWSELGSAVAVGAVTGALVGAAGYFVSTMFD